MHPQYLRHCSCWEPLLVSRPTLGTVSYGEVCLVSAASQNQWGYGNSLSAFRLLSQPLEAQERLVLHGYLPFVSVKCLIRMFSCLKRHIWKHILEARLGRVIKPAAPRAFLQHLSSDSWSALDWWTFCLWPLCFEDHALYLNVNTLHFAHLRPKLCPLSSLLLPQSTFKLCLAFMPHLYHCKTEENQALP